VEGRGGEERLGDCMIELLLYPRESDYYYAYYISDSESDLRPSNR
jgi:hypothetical protein